MMPWVEVGAGVVGAAGVEMGRASELVRSSWDREVRCLGWSSTAKSEGALFVIVGVVRAVLVLRVLVLL